MRPGLRNVLVTVVLAVAAGLGGAWAGVRYFAEDDHHTAPLHALLHDELDLTAAQERKLETAEARFAERRAALEAEIRKANAELAQAIRTSDRFGPEVQAAVEHFHTAMGDLQKETILHVFEMRAMLTPEQAAEFDEKVSRALTQEAG